MTNQPLESRWLDFYRSVSAGDAPMEQTDEMRVTFFCGAVALYSLICEQLKTPANADSTKAMQAIHEELGAFMQRQMGDVRLDS